MLRKSTLLIIGLIFLSGATGCLTKSPNHPSTFENLHYMPGERAATGPLRITWSNRELTFYCLTAQQTKTEARFMMVDSVDDKAMEYIVHHDQLMETRFCLPDGSLIRFEWSNPRGTQNETIVYHCTPYSAAQYKASWLPRELAHRIHEYQAGFSRWVAPETGRLFLTEESEVPYERIINTVFNSTEEL